MLFCVAQLGRHAGRFGVLWGAGQLAVALLNGMGKMGNVTEVRSVWLLVLERQKFPSLLPRFFQLGLELN